MSSKWEVSAGGVVVRGDETVVIVPRKPGPEGQRTLALPKGHPDAGETMEDAATREVREETGIQGRLLRRLGDVEYRSGSVEDHDDEIEEARWMPLEQAAGELSFPGEREMVKRALSRLAADR